MSNNWEYDYSELYNHTRQAQAETPATEPTPESSSKKPRNGMGKRILSGAMAVVFCGAVGFGGGYLGSVVAGKNNKSTILYQASAENGSADGVINTVSEGMTVAQIAALVGPSVVEVTTESVTTNSIFGQYVTDGAGSGVIISEDGYILTNNHVIAGAAQIKVTLSDKTQHTATLIGTDAKTDVAVLKIEGKNFTAAALGNSDTLTVGEFALAVGNPLGTLGGTVTDGIISALNRDVTIGSETMNLLQTNAAVSPGNSGGGLFNSKAELIGLVNAKSSGSDTEGLGFAIPINTALKVAEELMNNGYVTGRPALGVTVLPITDAQTAAQYGVSRMGVYVMSVTAGGPADKAGLKVGDMFVSIDGNAISDTVDVTGLLAEHSVGDTLEVQVVREKQVLTVQVVLEEKGGDTVPAIPQPEQNQEKTPALPQNPFQR